MSELSYFHDGTIRGDADSAPYYVETFHEIFRNIYASSANGVIFTSGVTDLQVTGGGPGNSDVNINAGAAFIEGVYFNNSASINTVLNTAVSFSRWDYVAIRVDWTQQQARIVIIQGQEAESPVFPQLQQDTGFIYEFPLAKIYVTRGTTTFLDSDVYDDRIFLHKPSDPPIINIMHNSEFIAGARTGYDAVGPAYWWTTNGPTVNNAIEYGSTLKYHSRGNRLVVTGGASSTLETQVYCADTSSAIQQQLVTLAFYIQVHSGTANLYINSSLKLQIRPTGEPLLVMWRQPVYSASDTFVIRISYTTSEFDLYQMTLAYGNNPHPPTPSKEIILYGASRNITGSAGRSTGTQTFVLATSLSGLPYMIPDVSGVIAKLKAWDSGSAGVDAVYIATDDNTIRIELGRHPNSVPKTNVGILPYVEGDYTITANLVASGVNTLGYDYDQIGAIT